jgi:hypothetical protein
VTVALPLHLAGQGTRKAEIAAFFVVGALTAATLVLTVGGVLRRIGVPRWSLSLCAAVSACGLVTVTADGPGWRIYPAVVLMMAMSLIYPLYIAVASVSTDASAAGTMATLRTVYVLGYLAGLGLFSLAAAGEEVFGPAVGPIRVAIGLAVAAALIALLPRSKQSADTGRAAAVPRAPVTFGVLAAAAAVLLMRAADSLRQVYLPLYALGEGVPGPLISTLFAVTVAVEVAVLAPLSAVCDRIGSRRTLLGVCVIGVLSFVTVVVLGGYPALVVSQVLYAVFAAGFQSIGMVMLGETLRSGLGGGAGAYTALVQVGATVGIVSPLLVPGYTVAVFWIAVLFCAGAAVLLVADPLLRRRQRRAPAPAEW